MNTPEGALSVHEQPFAGDGSNGQLLIVTVELGVKIGTTVPMPIRHPMAAKAGKNGAFLRVGMPNGPTLAAAKQRTAEVRRLQRAAGPQAPYAAQSPVKVCAAIDPHLSAKLPTHPPVHARTRPPRTPLRVSLIRPERPGSLRLLAVHPPGTRRVGHAGRRGHR